MKKEIVVRSPSFGLMHFTGVLAELIETPELQRLSTIRQLGPLYIVYPGAQHMRLLHAMEVSYTAMTISKHLKLPQDEIECLGIAGLLHDLGHGPYSHSTEILFNELFNEDHMDFTCKLITGEVILPVSKEEKTLLKFGQIPEILKKHGHDPIVVSKLIRKKFTRKPYMQQLIFGAIDADQLAFLTTDSRFSGVNYGDISLDTITEFFKLEQMKDGKTYLFASEKAIPAIVDMIMARLSMYNFYLTDTGLVIGNMIQSAIKKAYKNGELKNFYVYTDDELRTHLLESKIPFVREMGIRIKFRKLFKIAYRIKKVYSSKQMDFFDKLKKDALWGNYDIEKYNKNKILLKKFNEMGEEKIREFIFNKLDDGKITRDHIFINLKSLENIELTEPRLKEAREIQIIRDGKRTTFGELEPFFTLFIENATPVPATFYIAVPPEYKKKAKEIMEKLEEELLNE
ncbi:HD domain-containing protein [bacterium]|nr:HD domain-containing protein [bacterium]